MGSWQNNLSALHWKDLHEHIKGISIGKLNNIRIFSFLLVSISLTKHWMLTKISQEPANHKHNIQNKKKENPGVVIGIIKMAHLEIVTFLSPQFLFMHLHIPTFSGKEKTFGIYSMVSWNGLVLLWLCQVASSHTGYSPMNTNSTVLHYKVSNQ